MFVGSSHFVCVIFVVRPAQGVFSKIKGLSDASEKKLIEGGIINLLLLQANYKSTQLLHRKEKRIIASFFEKVKKEQRKKHHPTWTNLSHFRPIVDVEAVRGVSPYKFKPHHCKRSIL